ESIGPARVARGPVRGGSDQPDGGGPAGARGAGARRHLGPRHEPDGPHRRPDPREARLYRPGRRLRRGLRGARRRYRRRHSDRRGPGRRRPRPLPRHSLPARLRPASRRPRRLRRQPGRRGAEGSWRGPHHRRRRARGEVL
ncbi:MAG: hypothetical protein AVDCRST_MAG01-01-1945, partial [uncultured Rubrobacteraceae bacterium]